MKKRIIPENNFNVYCLREGSFTDLSKFVLSIENLSSTASDTENLNTILTHLKKCRTDVEKRIKLVEQIINERKQQNLF